LPATAKIIAASSVFGIFIPPLPAESTKPERRLLPLRFDLKSPLYSFLLWIAYSAQVRMAKQILRPLLLG
jgi:hypothetical protein